MSKHSKTKKHSNTNQLKMSGLVKTVELGETAHGKDQLEVTVRSRRIVTSRGKEIEYYGFFTLVKYGKQARRLFEEIVEGTVVWGYGRLDSQYRAVFDKDGEPLYDKDGKPGKAWQLTPVMTVIKSSSSAEASSDVQEADAGEAKVDADADAGEAKVDADAGEVEVSADAGEADAGTGGADAVAVEPSATEEAGTREVEPPATPVEEAQEDGAAEPEASETPEAEGDSAGEQVSEPPATPSAEPQADEEVAAPANDDPEVNVTATAMPLVVALAGRGVTRSEITPTGRRGADGRIRLTQGDAKRAAKAHGINVAELMRTVGGAQE
jgi:hypothetical protein